MAAVAEVRFGLTLPNRGVLLGLATVGDLYELTDLAEETPAWDSVWVGDSILAKPRLDALVLLGALAGRTERIRLGVGCLASMPLRDPLLLAYQWFSLDVLSGGRSILVACQGQPGAGGGRFREEFEALRIDPATRSGRMEEAIEIIRLTSASERVSFAGAFSRFSDVTVLPRPVQQPIPVWVTANPRADQPALAERALRRVARLGDGWMTTGNSPASFAANLAAIHRYAADEGRELPAAFEASLYYNINVDDDPERALATSKAYLEAYYGTTYERDFLERWVAMGSPEACAAHLRAFVEAGATTITLRVTSADAVAQFERITSEVLPAVVTAPGRARSSATGGVRTAIGGPDAS